MMTWLEDLVAENKKFHQERSVYHNKAYEYWLDVSRALRSIPADQINPAQILQGVPQQSQHQPQLQAQLQPQHQAQPTIPQHHALQSTDDDSGRNTSRTSYSNRMNPDRPVYPSTTSTQQPQPQAQTEPARRYCVAAYNYKEGRPEANSLNFSKHQMFLIIDDSSSWWLVQNVDTNERGYIPMNFARLKLTDAEEKRVILLNNQAKSQKSSSQSLLSSADNNSSGRNSYNSRVGASFQSTPNASVSRNLSPNQPTTAQQQIKQQPTTQQNATSSRVSNIATPSRTSGMIPNSVTNTPAQAATTPAPVSTTIRARARFDYNGSDSSFLSFKSGELLTIRSDSIQGDWWLATNNAGTTGYAPSNFLTIQS